MWTLPIRHYFPQLYLHLHWFSYLQLLNVSNQPAVFVLIIFPSWAFRSRASPSCNISTHHEGSQESPEQKYKVNDKAWQNPRENIQTGNRNIFIPNNVGNEWGNTSKQQPVSVVVLESKMQLRFNVVQAICGYCRYLYCYCESILKY